MSKSIKKIGAFEWAAIKLSMFYVLIAMIISIGFSVSIYNISSSEVGRELGRTFRAIDQCAPEFLPPEYRDLERARTNQLEDLRGSLKLKLVYFNFVILCLSSLISYFLARKTLRPLEEAMESQNRFTADASHELRTPLAAMRAEIEVALRDKNLSKEDAKKLLESNIEEISKLQNLSDALLKLARYQHNGLELSKLDISQIVVEAYEKIEQFAKQKNIEFVNELKSVDVVGDKQSLTELFVILIDNAIKYSASGSKIEITIASDSKNALVKIKDHGVGIKASDLPHIFERFYRADSSRTKARIDGYGLGLSLAKQIVGLHSGTISAKSIAGKGSEFTITLPMS